MAQQVDRRDAGPILLKQGRDGVAPERLQVAPSTYTHRHAHRLSAAFRLCSRTKTEQAQNRNAHQRTAAHPQNLE